MKREEHLFEELCKKGKAYRAKRMAAGEKSSAYLSGRAVKVCKGQMQGEGEEEDLTFEPEDMDNPDEDLVIIGSGYLDIKSNFKGRPNMTNDELATLGQKVVDQLHNGDKDAAFNYIMSQINEVYEEIDALHENEEYCPKCATKIKEAIREEVKKVAKEAKTKPSKGKRFAKKVKNPKTGRTRTVSYGQAGKAKKGGDRIRPGTKKGDAYCARSAKIKKCKNPPCANTLSRKKWKCQGSRSVVEAKWTD